MGDSFKNIKYEIKRGNANLMSNDTVLKIEAGVGIFKPSGQVLIYSEKKYLDFDIGKWDFISMTKERSVKLGPDKNYRVTAGDIGQLPKCVYNLKINDTVDKPEDYDEGKSGTERTFQEIWEEWKNWIIAIVVIIIIIIVLLVINYILSGNKPYGFDIVANQFRKESVEHPTLPPETIKQIVKDHSP